MSQVPADIKERRLALELGRSFCVQAPAGSGKTELLTQRYLSLLAACERPEEVLAITFTRKAAAEMRNRILDNMAQAAAITPNALAGLPEHKRYTLELAQRVLARDAALGWQLIDNSSRLRISTIDSFNAFLCGQLPVVSELGIMPDILDDPSALYEEAVLDLFTEVDNESPLADAIATLMTHVNNQRRTLAALLSAMLGRRDQWLGNILDIKAHPDNARAILEQTLQQLIAQKLTELAQALTPYEADLLPLLQFAAHNLAAQGDTALIDCGIDDGLPPAGATSLGRWQAIARLLLTEKHTLRKQVNKNTGFPSPSGAANSTDKAVNKEMKEAMETLLRRMASDDTLPALFEEFRHLPDAGYPDSQWQVLHSLTRVLPALVSRLSLVFRQHGQADHTQVSIAALSALGAEDAPTDLALRLDYRLRHILVDEFQDTSSLQISLLQKLTFGWQPGDGRTLFIVGDGMQSCYGFRNANVGLFLAARDNGIGQVRLDSLQLSVNFRSQATVVDWVNRHFAPAFPRHDDIGRGGVSFSPAASINPPLPDAGVELIILAADNEPESAKTLLRQREAVLVADHVLALQESCPGDSIALLVRTRNHLGNIIPELRRRGIAWHAADIDPLGSYPVIQDLLTLLKALLNPADVTAWYALLRTPWLGVALADIHRLSLHAQANALTPWDAMQQHVAITGLSREAGRILERVLPVLASARENRRRLPLRDWLEHAWLALGGAATLADAHLLASIDHFFDLVQDFDEHGDLTDIRRFENKVADQYADGLNPGAALTIMTIHKAKGLEFDHVILPGLERQPRADDNPLLRWREHISSSGDPELVLSMPAGRGQDRDPTYVHLKYEAALQQRLEGTRLFYIGVTRAIKSALLVGSVASKGGELVAPNQTALLAALWPQVENGSLGQVIPVMEEASPAPPDRTDNTLRIHRLPPSWQAPGALQPPGIAAVDNEDAPELPETVHDNLRERLLGDLLHDCLCRLGEGRLDLADDTAMTALEHHWRRRLSAVATDLDACIALLRGQLSRCAQDADFRWLLLEEHLEAASELSLSDYRHDRRRIAVIDRTFVDADDVRWIVDFKSGGPGDMDEAGFIAVQERLYRPQLARYADLFRTMETRQIRTALYFTALARLHPLDAGTGDA